MLGLFDWPFSPYDSKTFILRAVAMLNIFSVAFASLFLLEVFQRTSGFLPWQQIWPSDSELVSARSERTEV